MKEEQNMSMIEFKNVDKYYGNFHALKNINLKVEKARLSYLLVPLVLVKVHLLEQLMV